MGLTRNGVPYVVSALVPVVSGSRRSSSSALSAAASATSVLRAPATTTAFTLFAPSTARDAAAAREALAVLPVGAHRGEAHEVLARGADRHDVGGVALDGLDGVDGVARGQPPERAGGHELGALLGDLDVDRLRGAAGDDDGVEAGALHRGGEAAAERGVEEEAGERRLGGDEARLLPGTVVSVTGPTAKTTALAGS